MRRTTLLFASTYLLACSAGPAPAAPTIADSAGAEPAASWEELTTAALVALVRERAAARIAEVEPSLALDELDAWIATPTEAPPLGDRVSEQLIHLAIADLAADADDRARGLIRLIRARARNRNNAFVGTTLLSVIARRSADGEGATAAVRAVFAELPDNRFGGSTVVFQLFQNEGQVDARVEQLHGQLVSLDTAVTALFYEVALRPIVRDRAIYMSAIETERASREGRAEAPSYAFSTVDLTDAEDAEELVVAVWDTGVAGPLFGEQLFTAADGSHGVVADPTEGQDGLTFEPGEATVDEYSPFLRGVMDLRAGLASTEAAQRVLSLMGAAQDAEALEALQTNLAAIGEWAHGTHVAGIMMAGVPQARLAVFRSAWAGERRLYHHRGPTDEELTAERANVEAIAAFIRDNRVRVVNASLGFSRDYVENELRHESERYTSDEEVRARAEVVHAHRRESWRRVFESCPDTLFVVAAGNSNRDVVEYGDVPASLELPNLLVVGAVDRFGNWATFTNSNPERVQIFDHGVEVESVIPNGRREPLSGTSMASPNVANLATKILAVNSELDPAEVISLIVETATPIEAPFYGRVAHEERALRRARGQE